MMILPWSLFVFRSKPEDIGLEPYGYKPLAEHEDSFSRAGVPSRKAVLSIPFFCLFLFAGFAALSNTATDTHMPGYMVSINTTPTFAALMVSTMAAGGVIEKLVCGWLNDKIGVKATVFIQLGSLACGMLGIVLFHNPVVLLVSAVLLGANDSLMSVSVPLLIRQLFGSLNYTVIHSWVRVGLGLVGAASAPLIGYMYDISGDYVPAFMIVVVLYFAMSGLIIVAYMTRKRLVWEREDAPGVPLPRILRHV
jgi:MFS family permease